MRRSAVLLLLMAMSLSAAGFQTRPASDLRFDGQAGATFVAYRVASDGTDFLILRGQAESYRNSTLFTQRVADGRPVGPQREIGRGEPVGLAWNGADYLAAWQNGRSLHVATVSREGTLRSAPTHPVVQSQATYFAAGRRSAMAFGYEDSRFVAQPLDLDGRTSSAPVIHLAPAERADVVVGETAGGFAAVFTGWSGTWVMLFRPDGSSVTQGPVLLDGPYGSTTTDYSTTVASLAHDGADTLILFGGGKPGLAELRSIVVGPAGTVKSTAVLHASGGLRYHIGPAGVVWDGTQYVAAANIIIRDGEDRRPALLRIGRNGARIGELSWLTGQMSDRLPFTYGLATNGRRLLLPVSIASWPYRIFHAIAVDVATLQPEPPIVIGRTLATQTAPAIEAGARGYLAAWSERTFDETLIRASRIDAAGNYLDGDGIVLDRFPLTHSDAEPSINIDGNGPHWFVVWYSGRVIRGTSITRGGVAARGGAVTIGTGNAADVLWNGSQYVVLRAGDAVYKDVLTVNGGRVETTLLVPPEEVPYSDGSAGGSITHRQPSLVTVDGRPMAIFTRDRSECFIGTPGTCGEWRDAMGLALDVAGAKPFEIATYVWQVRAASGATRALALWSSYHGLFGSFVSPEGEVSSPLSIAADGSGPAVAAHGDAFVAAFSSRTTRRTLRTVRITGSGTLIDQRAITLDEPDVVVGDVAAGATLRPLVALAERHPANDSVRRAALLFTDEFSVPAAVPAAPAIVCTTLNADGTITVQWLPVENALGVSIELRLADGTFRPIGVAAAGATSTRVSTAGLEGSEVRVRAWNVAGRSLPSAVSPASAPPSASMAGSLRACAGAPVTIEMTLSGTAPFTVRWSDGVVQSDLGYLASRVVTARQSMNLKIVSVADRSCVVDETERLVDLIVDRGAAILEQTREVRIARGGTATLTIVSADADSIAWFEGDPGDTWRSVGATGRSFTTPALMQTTRYWARVSNRCGSVQSAPMTVTVTGKSRAVR